MLSKKEKNEMLEDALNQKRRQQFFVAEQKRPKSSRDLNEYIEFLITVQKIAPYKHFRRITQAEKNIL